MFCLVWLVRVVRMGGGQYSQGGWGGRDGLGGQDG